MLNPYPYTIDNGAGERLTFEGLRTDVEGGLLEAGNVVAPGAGPPMHVHYLQEEGFTVLSGRIGYQREGSAPQFAKAGESVVFAPGEPHRFWNAGDTELRCRGWVRPAGNTEFFLGALFASQRENGGTRPSLRDLAYLSRRYRSEFGTTVVPRPVQRLLFPVVVFAGRLTGRYARYADAPEPMKPSR